LTETRCLGYILDQIEKLKNVPLHNLMEELGGLPLLGSQPGGKWDSDGYSFEDLFIRCWQITSSLPIFNVNFSKDIVENEERFRLSVSQTSNTNIHGYLFYQTYNISSTFSIYCYTQFVYY
jgi:hypothetical protein